MEKKMNKTLDIRTVAKIAMNTTTNNNNDDDEDDVAIDFKKLYQNEKRKMKEQLQLQRQMVLQLQQQQQQQQEKDNDVNGVNLSTQHTVTHNISSQEPIDSINHNNINMEQIVPVYPEWVWNETYSTIVSTSSSSTPQHQLQTLKPNMIQYQQCFITHSIYRNELIRWLQQLPENRLVSSSSPSSSSYSNNINNEHNANGKWTWLPHAQRRVALFCHQEQQQQQQQQQQQVQQQEVPILFPQPLQLLIDQIMTMNLFPKQYKPNHILINEYQYSYQGILPHTDGPAYYPKTITISVGKSNVLFNFTPMIYNNNTNHSTSTSNNTSSYTNDYKSNESISTNHTNININDTTSNTNTNIDSFQVVLHGDGSLIVFENDAYTNCYHSINDLSKQHQNTNINDDDDHVNNEKTNLTNSNTSLFDEETEVAGPNCLNATNGTCIHRYPNRISITIRHKYVT